MAETKKRPLWFYVIGVIVALAIVNYIRWLIGGPIALQTSMSVSIGFLLGMLGMYIAVHLYSWK